MKPILIGLGVIAFICIMTAVGVYDDIYVDEDSESNKEEQDNGFR